MDLNSRKFARRLIIGLVWNTVSLAVMLFIPAGTLDEERFLRQELAGYNEYIQKCLTD